MPASHVGPFGPSQGRPHRTAAKLAGPGTPVVVHGCSKRPVGFRQRAEFVLYPFFLVWLVPATVIIVRSVGQTRMTMPDPVQGHVEVGSQPTTS